MSRMDEVIAKIKPLDPGLLAKAQARLDNLTKPPGSLGRLEELARQAVGITGDLSPRVKPQLVVTFAGDHGVVEEKVSAFPQEVTGQMVLNILAGGAGINVLSRHVGADVWVVDVGMAAELGSARGLIQRNVARGTANMAVGPAMTRDQAVESIEVGIEMAQRAREKGYRALATGEMGIGNTTPASAIAAVYSGLSIAEVTGRGTGLDDDGLSHKAKVIATAIEVNKPDKNDPLDVLAKVGGLELGAIAGLCLGGASLGLPVLVDGVISTAGALIAGEICPTAKEYMIIAHKSVEIGHQAMIRHMGKKPLLDLDFRLGEGTGAALGLGLLDASVKIMTEMATFESAGVTGEKV